jgi:quercetin dioxygenase-like cupin family protein
MSADATTLAEFRAIIHTRPTDIGSAAAARFEPRSRNRPMLSRSFAISALLVACLTSVGSAQSDKQGVTYRSPGGTMLRLMLDDTNVGPEVTVGEMTFPPNIDSGEHSHGAIEMFYVLSGELEHVVNGKSQILKPGMAGFVKPPDKIRHKTGPAGAKVVVIWVPGDEARKIVARWTKEP